MCEAVRRQSTKQDTLNRQIERPIGISGIRPGFWYAVCGRKAELKHDLSCSEGGCPNLCHVGCLGNVPEYDCGNTGHLRRRAGIRDQVTFIVWRPATPPATSFPENTEMDDLNNLSNDEKNILIINIRKELASTKGQLSEYCEIKDDLPSKRYMLVNALSIFDTLLAVKQLSEVKIVKKNRQLAQLNLKKIK